MTIDKWITVGQRRWKMYPLPLLMRITLHFGNFVLSENWWKCWWYWHLIAIGYWLLAIGISHNSFLYYLEHCYWILSWNSCKEHNCMRTNNIDSCQDPNPIQTSDMIWCFGIFNWKQFHAICKYWKYQKWLIFCS